EHHPMTRKKRRGPAPPGPRVPSDSVAPRARADAPSPATVEAKRSWRGPVLGGILALIVAAALYAWRADDLRSRSPSAPSASTTAVTTTTTNATAPVVPAASFVGRDACAGCHANQLSAWKGSDHDLAMQAADEKSVLGDFANAKFTYAGTTSTFSRRDGK